MAVSAHLIPAIVKPCWTIGFALTYCGSSREVNANCPTLPNTTATLFGAFAFAPNDVWAVGGSPDGGGPNDVILHYDGTAWTRETLPAPANVALFKVWGPSPDDLYVVGENAVIFHRKAGVWNREGEGVGQARLTTVFGCSAQEIYAVGGRDLLVSDGTTWKRADIVGSPLP